MNLNGKRIAIAKTNHMGDVVISLAMAGLIKAHAPTAKVIFMCRGNNSDVASASPFVDEVYDWSKIEASPNSHTALKQLNLDIFIHTNPCIKMSQIVKAADIKIRVGSLFRLYHWFSCNRIAFISRSSKKNKRFLDLQYLRPLGIKTGISNQQLQQFSRLKALPLKKSLNNLLSRNKFNLVIHPGSITANEHGFGIENYMALVNALDKEKFHIIISGIEKERDEFAELLKMDGVLDLMGRLSLKDYINFLGKVDGMIAGSTGPLHLTNAHQKYTLGLYRHNKKDKSRWQPIGNKAFVLSHKNGVKAIPVSSVVAKLKDWLI